MRIRVQGLGYLGISYLTHGPFDTRWKSNAEHWAYIVLKSKKPEPYNLIKGMMIVTSRSRRW